MWDLRSREQAEQLAAYLRKAGNRGASAWLDSKDFTPKDRAAILVALSDQEDPSIDGSSSAAPDAPSRERRRA